MKRTVYSIISYALIALSIIFLLVNLFDLNVCPLNMRGDFLLSFITFLLVIVAYLQLSKLSSSNSLQILMHTEQEWNSNDMKLGRQILANKLKNYGTDKTHFHADYLIEIGNEIEYILDFFEKVGLFTKEGEIRLKYVYELYSYYLQGYWEQCEEDYVKKIRIKYKDDDLYSQCEWLYNKIIQKYKEEKLSKDDIIIFCSDESDLKSNKG